MYEDDNDESDLGPWAAPAAANTGNAMVPARWADIYDNDDDTDLGPWAAYAASLDKTTAKKKKRNRKRGKKKPLEDLTAYADLAEEVRWAGRPARLYVLCQSAIYVT